MVGFVVRNTLKLEWPLFDVDMFGVQVKEMGRGPDRTGLGIFVLHCTFRKEDVKIQSCEAG